MTRLREAGLYFSSCLCLSTRDWIEKTISVLDAGLKILFACEGDENSAPAKKVPQKSPEKK